MLQLQGMSVWDLAPRTLSWPAAISFMRMACIPQREKPLEKQAVIWLLPSSNTAK